MGEPGHAWCWTPAARVTAARARRRASSGPSRPPPASRCTCATAAYKMRLVTGAASTSTRPSATATAPCSTTWPRSRSSAEQRHHHPGRTGPPPLRRRPGHRRPRRTQRRPRRSCSARCAATGTTCVALLDRQHDLAEPARPRRARRPTTRTHAAALTLLRRGWRVVGVGARRPARRAVAAGRPRLAGLRLAGRDGRDGRPTTTAGDPMSRAPPQPRGRRRDAARRRSRC